VYWILSKSWFSSHTFSSRSEQCVGSSCHALASRKGQPTFLVQFMFDSQFFCQLKCQTTYNALFRCKSRGFYELNMAHESLFVLEILNTLRGRRSLVRIPDCESVYTISMASVHFLASLHFHPSTHLINSHSRFFLCISWRNLFPEKKTL